MKPSIHSVSDCCTAARAGFLRARVHVNGCVREQAKRDAVPVNGAQPAHDGGHNGGGARLERILCVRSINSECIDARVALAPHRRAGC